ncbi:hypothetical protein BZG02_05860 [Labilibaculum filiforme]|uniref:DUF4159 domain-containing protein n=1 Tax=Labilibaculum filiforme TaxID=1940526 RepID=A0A2N3I213_9BACT|nr:DUF4159 domain-containing protein [Labilibaculum filiforme]PKQ64341.1 hypothetical protein BZG02_05860 [Labilibaculum filiforme]
MSKIIHIAFFLLLSLCSFSQNTSVRIGLLKYNGGGDWYANPGSLPNLIEFCNQNNIATIYKDPNTVEVGSSDLFSYPFVHLTGHGNIVLNNQEVANLRKYLEGGGFLHVDDNYGLNAYFRREIKKVFPNEDLVELPFSHPIYHQVYEFPTGLPKIHEHDAKAPQGFGIFHKGRLVCFYTFETDLGDGWEDPSVHNDTEINHQNALKMGANIISYSFSN